MKLRIIAIGAILCTGLAGCVDMAEVTTDASVAKVSRNAQRNMAGLQETHVRSFLGIRAAAGSHGGLTEIHGATCVLKGDGFRMQVVTPAKVQIPLAKDGPQEIDVTCKKVIGSAERTSTTTFGASSKDPTRYHDPLAILFL